LIEVVQSANFRLQKFWRDKIGAKKFGGKNIGGKNICREKIGAKIFGGKNLAGKWENFMTSSLLVGMNKLECLFLASLIRIVIYLQLSEGAYP
jgi:hypothetical protein